jgi:hypothetical protein
VDNVRRKPFRPPSRAAVDAICDAFRVNLGMPVARRYRGGQDNRLEALAPGTIAAKGNRLPHDAGLNLLTHPTGATGTAGDSTPPKGPWHRRMEVVSQ